MHRIYLLFFPAKKKEKDSLTIQNKSKDFWKVYLQLWCEFTKITNLLHVSFGVYTACTSYTENGEWSNENTVKKKEVINNFL